MEADFSGWATKTGLKCTDGRTIMPNAFAHMNGMQVPLVWQHGHDSPDNILGHVMLEDRPEGTYCYGFFNQTTWGQNAKQLVAHKDITNLSIYANQLLEKSKQVLHGFIREVSLVLSGANPGAKIDNVAIQHSDGEITELPDEAIIYTDAALEHADSAPADGPTIRDIYDSMTEEQKNVVNYMIGAALGQGTIATHSEETPEVEETEETPVEESTETTPQESPAEENVETPTEVSHQEGNGEMARNVFDQSKVEQGAGARERHVISHDDVRGIVQRAVKGGSLKHAVEEYALAHGINDIDLLFPDARAVMDRPEFDKRRTEWVAGVLNGTHHTPFSRIKTLSADLTLDEARAKGYVKGSLKKEEFFGIARRITTPTTFYKKQSLDRDDIIDITDFDIVVWLKAEMRMMLDEELARAILIGDGRDVEDEDKISESNIRPIATDDDLYVATSYVNLDDASSSWAELIDEMIKSRKLYKGTGLPTMFTTETVLSNLLLLKDTTGRYIYDTVDQLATRLRVSSIVTVEVMENVEDLLCVLVNLQDYTVGADKGGEVSFFDDFDIDYNKFKYLIEGRCSGALTKIRSALVYRKVPGGAALVVPAAPTQDDDEVTVVTTTGATYKIGAFTGAVTYNGSPVTVNQTITAAHPVVLPANGRVTIFATPTSSSYYFENNVDDEWTFVN